MGEKKRKQMLHRQKNREQNREKLSSSRSQTKAAPLLHFNQSSTFA